MLHRGIPLRAEREQGKLIKDAVEMRYFAASGVEFYCKAERGANPPLARPRFLFRLLLFHFLNLLRVS